MSNPRPFSHKKPWFKKHNVPIVNSSTQISGNTQNVNEKPVSGYYGFKLYFPILGNFLTLF